MNKDLDDWENSKDKSRLISYFIRWMTTQIVQDTRKKPQKKPILIETNKFIEFIPQLNEYHVANHSMLQIENSFSFGCAQNKLRFIKDKTIHLISPEDDKTDTLPKYPYPVHGIVSFCTEKINVEQIEKWKKFYTGKIGVIFPSEYEESFRRLMFEQLYPCKGPIRLDYLYHGRDDTFGKYPHIFIKQKFGTSLTVDHFEFLSHWSCAIFSMLPHKVLDKKTTETKESNSQ
jgi:hypothetical protein